ncbi:hypothetical protein [Aggregatilinea lenta]|uniref:hypothetical protein n=1 Tax=Aggregatilinea lenta TaxID=913108 RepID=UPI000E5B3FBC|nr:hypothetical protein [Aggregatilinea lenta]
MDLEHRVQMLEEEVQILKNQIQASLLDIQEHLLTNKYPALRTENAAIPERSSPISQPAAPVVTVPAQPAPIVEPADLQEPDLPTPAVIRKVSLDAITSPASSTRYMEPELPPPPRRTEPELPSRPRYAEPEVIPQPRYSEPELSVQRRYSEPALQVQPRYSEPELPAQPRYSDLEPAIPLRSPGDSASRSDGAAAWKTDPDGFLIPPLTAPKHVEPTTPFEAREPLTPVGPGARPFIVDDDLPPSLDEGTPVTEADWATLTQLQEWTIKRVNALGPDHARTLIKRYAQEKRISEHVKDTLLQLVTIIVAEGSESSEHSSAQANPIEFDTSPRQENEEGVTPRLIARLIAGIRESGASSEWSDRNG